MQNSKVLIGGLIVTVFVTLAYAADGFSNASQDCLTKEQVLAHANRSRQGVSLTCNEIIRQRQLTRQGISE